MPRPPVKRHTIFCHACPSPALLSTACAIVINNKTDKTRGLPCLAPISAPSVLFIILLRIIRLKIRRFQDFCYVAPPFEQCCTSSTSSDAVRAALPAHPANGGMFSCTLQTFKHRFLCVICPELLHSYHNCNVDSFFATDEQFQYGWMWILISWRTHTSDTRIKMAASLSRTFHTSNIVIVAQLS